MKSKSNAPELKINKEKMLQHKTYSNISNNLTREERLSKICSIILRGIYIFAKKESWIA